MHTITFSALGLAVAVLAALALDYHQVAATSRVVGPAVGAGRPSIPRPRHDEQVPSDIKSSTRRPGRERSKKQPFSHEELPWHDEAKMYGDLAPEGGKDADTKPSYNWPESMTPPPVYGTKAAFKSSATMPDGLPNPRTGDAPQFPSVSGFNDSEMYRNMAPPPPTNSNRPPSGNGFPRRVAGTLTEDPSLPVSGDPLRNEFARTLTEDPSLPVRGDPLRNEFARTLSEDGQ